MVVALRVARGCAAQEGSADSLAVKHPGRKARQELVRETGHKGRIAALAATSKRVMKAGAGKGAVLESWAPENLSAQSAEGEADVPPVMQQLELAFVVFVRNERTRDGLKLVGLRNRL